jgi:hypothetical protein
VGSPNRLDTAPLIAQLAALPNPRDYRQQLPGSFWRKWEWGIIGSRYEFWRELERVWGPEFVARLLGVPLESEAA